MNTCKDCTRASYLGHCDLKQAWTILNAPACESFELHPDNAIRAKEKELAAVHGTVCDLEDMLTELFECLEGHCTANLQ